MEGSIVSWLTDEGPVRGLRPTTSSWHTAPGYSAPNGTTGDGKVTNDASAQCLGGLPKLPEQLLNVRGVIEAR
jgi:hypothetical protein